MKQLSLIALIAFSLLGCSSEDSDALKPASNEKTIHKTTSFNERGEKIVEIDYDNGKETYLRSFIASAELRSTYNSRGLLSRVIHKDINSGETTTRLEYSYDNLKRLIKTKGQLPNGGSNFEYQYDYTQKNKIVRKDIETGTESVFFINEENLIYRELIDNLIDVNVTYEDDLIVESFTVHNNDSEDPLNRKIVFEYSENNKPKGGQNMININKFGTVNNIHLVENLSLFPIFGYTKKLVTKSIDNGFERTFRYSFDSDGYIIKEEELNEDNKVNLTILYEYE